MGKIPKTYDGWEAYGYLLSSAWYLVTHPKVGTPFLLLLLGGTVNEVFHYNGITVSVAGKAKPVDVQEDGSFMMPNGENSDRWRFVLIPEAHAQDKSRTWKSENAIVIDRKFYEFEDNHFKLFKKEGANQILVYYKPTKTALWWEAESGMFDVDRYKP